MAKDDEQSQGQQLPPPPPHMGDVPGEDSDDTSYGPDLGSVFEDEDFATKSGDGEMITADSQNGRRWTHLPTVSFKKVRSKNLGRILIESGALTEDQLEEALSLQSESQGKKLGEILIEKDFVTEDDMLKALAYQLNLPFYEKLPVNEIDPSLVDGISMTYCRDNAIIPISKDDFGVTVAVADPLNLFALDDLRLVLSTNINVVVSPPSLIRHCINKVYERANNAFQKVLDDKGQDDLGELEETRDLLEVSEDEKPVVRQVYQFLTRAVKEGASDIHIEPYENEIAVRLRIDGVLRDIDTVQKRWANSIASVIKIIGKLDIAEKRLPQDSRFAIRVAGKDIDVRLSVLPTAHGERIVMRLLDKSAGSLGLEEMGLEDELYRNWVNLIEQTHGIILVTGPTGSGKTTLLYSSLMHINTTDINILTIEDPVEYQLAGVGQIAVREKIGLTFSAGLRSILRQDPNVIMIGEIRDAETAAIAIQSSMTGHLVMSTVHTNDTASTVSRLLDLNVQSFQISSAVLGVIATRLLRKLCDNCKEPHTPDDQELKLMGMTREELGDRVIYKQGRGCAVCSQKGYKGRLGVHELLIIDEEIRRTIAETPDAKIIKKVAIEKGMKTLRDSAIEKVLKGLTSIEVAIQSTQTDDISADLGDLD